MKHDALIVPPGKKIRLKDFDPGYTGKYQSKDEAREKLEADTCRLAEYQDVLYAQNTYALLIIFQAMDAAGKDGTIKHVMSGVNPQGTQVFSFKAPSAEELDHDYLWRYHKAVPERGRIGIFNRSYYEELLVVRVHPEFLRTMRRNERAGMIITRRSKTYSATRAPSGPLGTSSPPITNGSPTSPSPTLSSQNSNHCV